MEDTSKYLIHARITADGVVERSDVVGAVFGQTEGLLGDELDLRDLQRSSKVGRIDVEIDSEHGQSFGEITITSSLDRVETAILAASLESITRVGPCEARVEVAGIEDMRAAKRREVVERAKELLVESFDEGVMDSDEILEEVRDAQRVEQVDEFADYPAGPRVSDSDAVIVVEGRADVSTLLEYGIKNAIAVEGTDVPDAVADLTDERTVTAFLDGDRGGDLILRELAQVGDVDYVAYAPENVSVEDLSRENVMDALREKVPFETLETSDGNPRSGDRSATEQSRAAGDTDDGTEAGRTTGSVRTSAADGRESIGGVGTTDDSVTVDAAAVVDEIADDHDGETSEVSGETHDVSSETPETAGEGGDEEATADATETDEASGAVAASAATNGETADTGVTDDQPDTEASTTDGQRESGDADVGSDGADAGSGDADVGSDDADAGSGDADVGSDEEASGDTDTESETAADESETTADESETTADESETAADESETTADESETATDERQSDDSERPATLRGHVRDVIDAGTNTARVLDRELEVVAEVPAGEAFDTLADDETLGFLLVLDGRVDQRLLDVAAQRGIEQIVAASSGEFVKRPASVRVVTADRLASA